MRKLAFILCNLLLWASPTLAEFSYDGTGDNHTIANPNVGHATVFTICFWVNAATLTDGQSLVGYGKGIDSSTGTGWSLTLKESGANNFVRYDGWAGSGAAATTGGDNTGGLTDATWHHWCFSKGGVFSSNFYVDGTLTYSPGLDGHTVQDSADDFFVADNIPLQSYGYGDFNGKLAHVAYWQGTALSGAEVASLADKSTCPTDVQSGTLEVFLPLTADPAIDESANGFTVTTNGTPTLGSTLTGLPCGSAPAAKFSTMFNRNLNKGFNRKLN